MTEKISLYNEHSYAACISEGFKFLAKQLLLVTMVMMPYFTATAFFAVLSIGFNTKLNVAIMANQSVGMGDIAWAMLLFTLAYAAFCISNGRMFLMFRRLTGAEIAAPEDLQKQEKASRMATIKRTLQLTLLSLPYLIWPYIINLPGYPIIENIKALLAPLATQWKIAAGCGMAIVGIIAIIFLTPIIYTYYCRMMKPSFIDKSTEEGKRQEMAFHFKQAYKDGWRYKGKTIGITVLAAFIMTVSSLVLLLPGIVSMHAYFSSIESSINFGDTTVIPTSGYIFMIVSSTVALAFALLLSIAFFATLLYLHGDIYHRAQLTHKK